MPAAAASLSRQRLHSQCRTTDTRPAYGGPFPSPPPTLHPPTPPAAASGGACKAFAAAVAATPVLSKAFDVEVFTGGVLGGELEITQACIDGTLDLAVTASNVVAGIVPEIGLLDAPFLFRDARHARAALDGPIGAELTDLLRAKNVNPLAGAENGMRHVTANRPMRQPQDLRGVHIRVPQSEVMVEAFRELGA